MARYIKANPKVAKFLNLESDRNTVKDGNYLLWQADMLAFGPLTQLADTLQQIGGIALLPHEAREEQDGTVTRPLPQATDPRFIVEPVEPETEAPAEGTEPTGGEVNAGESETNGQQAESGDAAETSTDESSEVNAGESETDGQQAESGDAAETSADESREVNAGESETNGQQAEGDTPETPTDESSEAPAEETTQSNDEVESTDSGDVGGVDEVLNANDKEE